MRHLLASLLAVALAVPAMAQNLFAPAVIVNDRAITNYQIGQRARFYEVLNAPGDPVARAREVLVDEALQVDAALRQGVTVTPEELDAGMAEFAARANLSTEELLAAFAQEGVEAQTFRDFVRNGILWRNVIRLRFGRQAQITEDEIDRALTLGSGRGGAEVTVAEIILPLVPGEEEATQAEANRLSQELDGNIAGFSAAARRLSAAPTRQSGGVVPTRPLSAFPPGLRALILPLNVGDTTDPVPLGPAIAIFQLRDLTETGYVAPEVIAVEYAVATFPRTPDAAARAAALTAATDTCDDLYGTLPGGFERVSQEVAEVPADVALELARLDADEVSTGLVRDGTLTWIMLCGRTTQLSEEGDREQVRDTLRQQRLVSLADGYLEELRADAIIREGEGG